LFIALVSEWHWKRRTNCSSYS